jgi:hypothetical protein
VLHGMRVLEDFVGCRENPITPPPGKEPGFVSASLCDTRRPETMASGGGISLCVIGFRFAVGGPVPVACG